MQVNERNVKHYGLDKDRLVSDIQYSIDAGAMIFKWFYLNYPLDEAISRYNCGTKNTCITWSSVIRYKNIVKSAM